MMKLVWNPKQIDRSRLLATLAMVLIAGCSGEQRSALEGSDTVKAASETQSTDGKSVKETVNLSPIRVELVQGKEGQWQLLRNGQAYSIKGAGGEGSLSFLAACGGNSGRLWGVDGNTMRRLDEAHQNGLTMAVGIWLEHSQKGFDYSNDQLVAKQFASVIEAVEKYKNHPAVLVWGLGNEMEGYESGDNPDLWKHVESLAAKIKAIDPNHPTMTVVAEISDSKIAAIHKYCPSLDIVGINSYGGSASLGERYGNGGGIKPYIVTEFGPVGTWEVPKNSIDVIVEPTSNAKSEMYRKAYRAIKMDSKRCLGAYAFLWGNKQEGTSTWFGLLLPSGRKVNAVDVMTEEWTGKPPANRCPEIREIKIVGSDDVAPEALVEVQLAVDDPEGAVLDSVWTLTGEADSYVTGGHFQETPPTYDSAIVNSSLKGATVKMPQQSGVYRLYVEVHDGDQAAATANIPIRVSGKDMVFDEPTALPYVIYDDSGSDYDFTPSGWMGGTDVMKMDTASTDNPKSGKNCIECSYQTGNGWGGVVWQNPPGDWGELAGGRNFTGARKLTFWARGAEGGEKVKFGFGLLGREKAFWDTTKKEKEFVLKNQWEPYSIDLENSNLSRIKSPFLWVVSAEGKPVKFYIDNIVVE